MKSAGYFLALVCSTLVAFANHPSVQIRFQVNVPDLAARLEEPQTFEAGVSATLARKLAHDFPFLNFTTNEATHILNVRVTAEPSSNPSTTMVETYLDLLLELPNAEPVFQRWDLLPATDYPLNLGPAVFHTKIGDRFSANLKERKSQFVRTFLSAIPLTERAYFMVKDFDPVRLAVPLDARRLGIGKQSRFFFVIERNDGHIQQYFGASVPTLPIGSTNAFPAEFSLQLIEDGNVFNEDMAYRHAPIAANVSDNGVQIGRGLFILDYRPRPVVQ